MSQKMNIVFTGGFTYPRGMAATKRIQNLIDALKDSPDIDVRVIIQRQSMHDAAARGEYAGTPYEIIMGDLFRVKMFLALPLLYYKTIAALRNARRQSYKNIIYFYGPIFVDSIVPLYCARMLGYKIIFDVTEDFGLAKDVSRSLYQHIRSSIANRISYQIKNLASGIIVISSYLEKQIKLFTKGKVPMHYMPISVDVDRFQNYKQSCKSAGSLFYAGSFGKKDGVLVLLDAFDKLAGKYAEVRLVLTGRGDEMAMREFFARVDASPYKERIEYKGYLSDEDYHSLLSEIDIPCMTRVDLAFAQAGFPFKLGEYLATGRPVIASRVSDVDRFLTDRDNAMLVEAGSSDEVCAAVEFLLDNPEDAANIGEKGRAVAKRFFDNKQQGSDFVDFLGRI